jgi:hypothetical protein
MRNPLTLDQDHRQSFPNSPGYDVGDHRAYLRRLDRRAVDALESKTC